MNKNETRNNTMKTLKVIGVQYFGNATNGMIGYKCTTNIKDLFIMNGGNGGATYLQGNESKYYSHLSELELERLIDEFEGVHYNG
jgi:hypothetical protein